MLLKENRKICHIVIFFRLLQKRNTPLTLEILYFEYQNKKDLK